MWRERLRGPMVLGALLAFVLPLCPNAFQSTPPSVENSALHNATEIHNVSVAQHVHNSSHKRPLTERAAVQKALTVAANEYAHLETVAANKKIEADDKAEEIQRQRIHQQAHAEQLEAQKTIQKVLKAQQQRNLKKGLKIEDEPKESTPPSAFERKLKFVEQEEKDKERELSVQMHLAKEKTADAQQAKKVVDELKMKAEKIRQEADISAKIAQEKQEAAQKMAAQEAAAEKKLESLSEEGKMTEKFLAQTHKAEAALQAELKKLKEQRAASQKVDAADRKRKAEAMKKKAREEADAAQRDLEAANREELAAEEKDKEEAKSKPSPSPVQETKAVKEIQQNQTAAAGKAVRDPKAEEVEQVKRLLEENARLQHQNQDLEKKLEEKKEDTKPAPNTNSTKKSVSKTKAFFLLEENEKLREATASLKRQLMSTLKA